MTLPATKQREILALVDDVNRARIELARQGIGGLDLQDREQAMRILQRIEANMIARMPTTEPAQ